MYNLVLRGETEPLYAGNQKEEGRNKWTKFCCWIFILALLAGAITVGVLIACEFCQNTWGYNDSEFLTRFSLMNIFADMQKDYFCPGT